MIVRSRRAGVLAAVVFVLLGGCSLERVREPEAVASGAPGGSPEVSPMPSGTGAPGESPDVSGAPEFVSGGECPLAERSELPGNAGCVTTSEGDVDGDGATELLSLFARLGDDGKPEAWHVHVETATGTVTHEISAGNAVSYSRALGVTDIDGDGRAEWWIKVYDLASHGTNWQRARLFVLQGERLSPVAFDGAPLDVNVGGISRMGEGASCRDGRIVLLRAEAKNVRNTRWRYSERTYLLRRAEVRFEERMEGWLRLEHYNDPKLDPYYRIECAGLSYP